MKKLIFFIALLLPVPAIAYDDVESAKVFTKCLIKKQRQNHYDGGTVLVQACQPEYKDFIHYCGGYEQCNAIAAKAVYTILQLDAQGRL